jgi:hypothetical protein
VLLNTVSEKHTAFLRFCFRSMIFCSPLQFLILCGTGFEVLTVAVIHYVYWVRTAYRMVHSYECSGGPFCLSSQAIGRYRQYAFAKTSVPTNVVTLSYNLKTKHLNLNILVFPCIVSLLLQTNSMHILCKKVCLIIVNYISIWAELSRSNVMHTKQI